MKYYLHSGLRSIALLVAILATALILARESHGQTASSGALTGVTLDPSGAVLPDVVLHLVNLETGETVSTVSDKEGRFSFSLLSPASYELQASKTDFALLRSEGISIAVTETHRLELHLELATVVATAEVSSVPLMVQTDNSALGRGVNGIGVSGLPLVTRNFAQIAALSSGVTAGVFNAGELGLGGMALSQINKSNDGIYVH